jgi:hypothetical protein
VREEVIPLLKLRELLDDPTNNRRGSSFLEDPRNRAALSTTTISGEHVVREDERWLLNRVLSLGWLREEILEARMVGTD